MKCWFRGYLLITCRFLVIFLVVSKKKRIFAADFFVKAGEKPDLDELSKAEIEALDTAIDKYKDMDTKTLSELSHDSAWHEAWDKNHNAVMTSLNIAKAGDASNEFLEYLQEQEFIDSILGA